MFVTWFIKLSSVSLVAVAMFVPGATAGRAGRVRAGSARPLPALPSTPELAQVTIIFSEKALKVYAATASVARRVYIVKLITGSFSSQAINDPSPIQPNFFISTVIYNVF